MEKINKDEIYVSMMSFIGNLSEAECSKLTIEELLDFCKSFIKDFIHSYGVSNKNLESSLEELIPTFASQIASECEKKGFEITQPVVATSFKDNGKNNLYAVKIAMEVTRFYMEIIRAKKDKI